VVHTLLWGVNTPIPFAPCDNQSTRRSLDGSRFSVLGLDRSQAPSFLQQTAIMSKNVKEFTREEVQRVRFRLMDVGSFADAWYCTAQQGRRPGQYQTVPNLRDPTVS